MNSTFTFPEYTYRGVNFVHPQSQIPPKATRRRQPVALNTKISTTERCDACNKSRVGEKHPQEGTITEGGVHIFIYLSSYSVDLELS